MKKKRMTKRQLAQQAAEAADREEHRKYWEGIGYSKGEAAARKAAGTDLTLQRMKANLELCNALSRLTENVARAIVTVISEGGVPRS